MKAAPLTALLIIVSLSAAPLIQAATTITDNFDSFNTTMWRCEYACPTVADGFARFTLDPGPVNSNTTWSKLSYKDKMFGYGTYSMRFKYNRRPLETEIWAGWALYMETPEGLVNEINFGIETACKTRCTDSTLIMESYKNSKNIEVVVPVGVSLFDGVYHTVDLLYTSSEITMHFDGRKVASITDESTIPTVGMKLIPGARVVTGTLDSRFYLDVDSLYYSDSILAITPVRHKSPLGLVRGGKDLQQISLYDIAGRLVGTFSENEWQAGTQNVTLRKRLTGTGVYIVCIRSGSGVISQKRVHF